MAEEMTSMWQDPDTRTQDQDYSWASRKADVNNGLECLQSSKSTEQFSSQWEKMPLTRVEVGMLDPASPWKSEPNVRICLNVIYVGKRFEGSAMGDRGE